MSTPFRRGRGCSRRSGHVRAKQSPPPPRLLDASWRCSVGWRTASKRPHQCACSHLTSRTLWRAPTRMTECLSRRTDGVLQTPKRQSDSNTDSGDALRWRRGTPRGEKGGEDDDACERDDLSVTRSMHAAAGAVHLRQRCVLYLVALSVLCRPCLSSACPLLPRPAASSSRRERRSVLRRRRPSLQPREKRHANPPTQRRRRAEQLPHSTPLSIQPPTAPQPHACDGDSPARSAPRSNAAPNPPASVHPPARLKLPTDLTRDSLPTRSTDFHATSHALHRCC